MNFKIQLLSIFITLAVAQCASVDLEQSLFKELDGYFQTESLATLKANDKTFASTLSLTGGSSTINSMKIHGDAIAILNAYNKFIDSNQTESVTNLVLKNYRVPELYCPDKNYEYYECNDKYPYRYIDGACNNLYVPWWGKAETPYNRIVVPAYDDGINSPRTKSVIDGYELPNARTVALNIHKPQVSSPPTTHLLVFFAQHIMHDLVLTGRATYSDGSEKVCGCNEYEDPECFPIQIPYEDYYNQDQECFPFTRSSAAIEDFMCQFSYREQINLVTHWLDQSPVYGNSIDVSRDLRSYHYGLLKTTISPDSSHDLPVKEGCSFQQQHDCYLGGDIRMQDNTYLTLFDRVFVLEHNRIATELYKLNPTWDDDILYQEARKINIAQYQHIIYYELLPILLGGYAMNRWDLVPLSGHMLFNGYDKNINPQVKNAFTIAARFGHTLINKWHYAYDNEYNLQYNVTTNYILFTHTYYSSNVMRGALLQNVYYSSPAINNVLNNYLFEGVSTDFKRLSLGALNIQRGRDQGLPGYNKYRAWCGLNYAYSFDDLTNIPAYIRNELAYLYTDVDDIDLFTGLTSEYSTEDGVVGHTAACILGAGFRDWKYGDRYYYENNNKLTGFSGKQLYEIRKSSMARLICDNTDIYFIQGYPFLEANQNTNPLMDCSQLPSVDLSKWDY